MKKKINDLQFSFIQIPLKNCVKFVLLNLHDALIMRNS